MSIFFVLLSTVIFVLSTIPEFKTEIITNHTNSETNKKIKELKDHPFFEITETVCIAWFTFEFIIRFWSSPNKIKFFKGFLNIIDIISILPFYFSLIFEKISTANTSSDIHRLLTLLRVLRVMRIFKLARHSTGLKAFGYTMKNSGRELGLLGFFVSLAVLLFSSFVYFAEKGENETLFKSIPHTFW